MLLPPEHKKYLLSGYEDSWDDVKEVSLSELHSDVMDGKLTLSCGGETLPGWLTTGNGLRSQL